MSDVPTQTTDVQTRQPAEAASKRRPRKLREGVVVSDVRNKTIRVVHEFTQRHPKYGKIIRRRATLHVHDENNEARIGDVVEVMACRPISKQKSWRLVRVITRGPAGR